MLIFILSFFMMLVMMLAMILGSIILKRPISGSCGGLAALGMKKDCAICGDNTLTAPNDRNIDESLFYDASKQVNDPKDGQTNP